MCTSNTSRLDSSHVTGCPQCGPFRYVVLAYRLVGWACRSVGHLTSAEASCLRRVQFDRARSCSVWASSWVQDTPHVDRDRRQSSAMASSSSSAPSSGPGTVAEPPMGNASLAVHRGVVYLDQTGSSTWMLTHILTLEAVPLESVGELVLLFDNDGYGAVVYESGEVRSCEDLFGRQLFGRDTGERVIVGARGGPEAAFTRPWSLTFGSQRFAQTSVTVISGVAQQHHNFEAYRFDWPRMQASVFWSFKSLYSALGLQCFKKSWSSWCWAGFERWHRFLDSIGLGMHLCQSAAAMKNRCEGLPLHGNDLPTPGVSSWGMLALLSRWSSGSRKQGCLDTEDARHAAGQLLRSFLVSLGGVRRWALEVRLAAPWQSRWPRPEAVAPKVDLPVLAEGMVDMVPLAELASRPGNQIASDLYGVLQKSLHGERSISLQRLLAVAAADKGLARFNFLGQVVWRVGQQLEITFLAGHLKAGAGRFCRSPCTPSRHSSHSAPAQCRTPTWLDTCSLRGRLRQGTCACRFRPTRHRSEGSRSTIPSSFCRTMWA